MNITFQLIAKNQCEVILPLLHAHDPSIAKDVVKARLTEMFAMGYECVGLYDGTELIGICGLWTLVKYYVGRHIEPDNVYIKPAYRSLGLGRQLDTWLQAFALARGCEAIELNCYIKNEAGNHFWTATGYKPIGVHYQKKCRE